MKTIILILSMLFITIQAHAAWYIINQDTNRAVSVADYKPDEADLASRNEIAIQSDEDVALEDAEYLNGKIRKRAKSQAEKNAIKEAEEEEAEMGQVYHRMFTDTYKALKAEGKTFKYMHKHIDAEDL